MNSSRVDTLLCSGQQILGSRGFLDASANSPPYQSPAVRDRHDRSMKAKVLTDERTERLLGVSEAPSPSGRTFGCLVPTRRGEGYCRQTYLMARVVVSKLTAVMPPS